MNVRQVAVAIAMAGVIPGTSVTVGAQVSEAPARTLAVRGVAYDSLRGVPLPNAFITLVGIGRSVISDDRGRFTFDSIPAGTHLFAMQHDALDSLGYSRIAARATVDGSREIHIALPSFETLWRRTCPGDPPSDSGFVVGVIRSALDNQPVANAAVDLRWIDTRADRKTGIAQRLYNAETRSDSTGRYVICGVPSATWLRIGAGMATGATGWIHLPPTELRVQRRDLMIGATAEGDTLPSGIVSGTLRDTEGRPLADARVVLEDGLELRSGSDGRFVIPNLAPGSRQIEVMSIGMAPVVAVVDVRAGDTTAVIVELRKVTTLEVMRVIATRRGVIVANEIEERKKSGFGYIMETADIAGRGSFVSVMRDMPSAHVKYAGGSYYMEVNGPTGPCIPTVWIDGSVSAFAAVNMLQPVDVMAVEFYPRASTLPHKFLPPGMKTQCGALVIWTKWLFGREMGRGDDPARRR